MAGDELDELLRDCPVLFHMAEAGSWPSIRRHGLLSTSALLDRFAVAGDAREAIEAGRRATSVVLEHPDLGRAVIRDNKPIGEAGLRRCLQDGLAPADWFRLLNARVFFWLSAKRLDTLLAARTYADRAHDVLEVDARALVAAHAERITLSPINSGATGRFPVSRGLGTFASIDAYPYADWRGKRAKGERVVEFAVLSGVPDIEQYVLRVVRRGGGEEPRVLWARGESD